jgi:dihydrofolate synthase/folylpolyglutamate synthase
MTYAQALKAIDSLQTRGWRLELDRMLEFAIRAGIDDYLGEQGRPNYIHIAGTNGKGTTTAFVQSILTEAYGLVGGYYSPYVFDPKERIQGPLGMIDEAAFANLVQELWPVAESLDESVYGGPTEFEFKTAMGILYWKQCGCQWVALEVGLGGRLDATNIVTASASVLVSIGLDHMSILGDTIEKIAFEKAGIIKSERPVVMGLLPPEARQVVEKVANDRGSTLWRVGEEIQFGTDWVVTPNAEYQKLDPTDFGVHTMHNLAVAIGAIDAAEAKVSIDELRHGVSNAWLPGRLQPLRWQDRDWVLDGAHNPDSAKALASHLRMKERPIHLLTGMVAGHDPTAFYAPLSGLLTKAHVCPINFYRAQPPDEIASVLLSLNVDSAIHPTLEDGVNSIVAESSNDALLVVTGSFYLVGEILALHANSVSNKE